MMLAYDLIVVGGGVSGLSLAAHAAGGGRRVAVLEAEPEAGGCLATHRTASGFWFELGAHTLYRSYVETAALVERCGLRSDLVRRARTRLRFVDGDRVLPGSNLGALLRRMHLVELARSLPRLLGARKEGQTVYAYYAALVGRRNYGEVLGPMLSAVPSQTADAFPAELLFKRRATRRDDLPRSFTLRNGLRSLPEALARVPGVEVRCGLRAAAIALPGAGRPGSVTAGGGETFVAPIVALATPPGEVARLLRPAHAELATWVARIGESRVESLGFSVPRASLDLPPSTFLIPRDDAFHSVVSRDALPDPERRAFTFHFRPGLTAEAKLERARRLLRLAPDAAGDVAERAAVLPSPVLGHAEVVAEIDRLLAGLPLLLTGNWFGGLSIEDCVVRSKAEWARAVRLGATAAA